MKPIRILTFALASIGLLTTAGCGMVDRVFGDGPSARARTPAAAPRPAADTEREREEAPPEPRVTAADRLTGGDRAVIERMAARAMASGTTGEPVAWRNPQSGNHGTITATSPAYRGQNRRLCRDYQLTVSLGGRRETLVGTRCRGSGGRWPEAN